MHTRPCSRTIWLKSHPVREPRRHARNRDDAARKSYSPVQPSRRHEEGLHVHEPLKALVPRPHHQCHTTHTTSPTSCMVILQLRQLQPPPRSTYVHRVVDSPSMPSSAPEANPYHMQPSPYVHRDVDSPSMHPDCMRSQTMPPIPHSKRVHPPHTKTTPTATHTSHPNCKTDTGCLTPLLHMKRTMHPIHMAILPCHPCKHNASPPLLMSPPRAPTGLIASSLPIHNATK